MVPAYEPVFALAFNLPLQKRERNWVELTFAKTSGIILRDRKKIGQ